MLRFLPPGVGRTPPEVEVGYVLSHAGRRYSVAGGTRTGNQYRANFDVLHVDQVLPLVAVADGMGDGPGATLAGDTAVRTLVDAVRGAVRGAVRDAGHPVDVGLLRAAVAEAQTRVRTAGGDLKGLTGATLTALVPGTDGGPGWIVQLGDSRAYRLRDGLLELLTTDHNRAWLSAVHGGQPGEAPRYQLTRFVGHPADPEPDLLSVSLRPGDVYCLCTDGVSEAVSHSRLARRLGSGLDPIKIVHDLLSDVLAAGGRDNATVTLLRVEPDPVPT